MSAIENNLSFSHLAVNESDDENGSDDESEWSIVVSVFGMHCASCMRMIENALYADSKVKYARVNLTSEKLTLSWNGDANECNRLLAIVCDLGFKVKEYKFSSKVSDFENKKKHLLKCLAVSGFAMGNIMLISIVLWTTTMKEMGYATTSLLHWISALIAIPVLLYSGSPFFKSAFKALRKGNANMDVPISLALLLTSFMSII